MPKTSVSDHTWPTEPNYLSAQRTLIIRRNAIIIEIPLSFSQLATVKVVIIIELLSPRMISRCPKACDVVKGEVENRR